MTIVDRLRQFRDQLSEVGLIKFLKRVFQEFGADDGTTMAAGIAYYSFLAAFPLILALIGLLGYFLPSAEVQDRLFEFFRNNIPGAVDVLQNNIQSVINLRGTLGVLGILGLLWSGTGAISAIGHAINKAWDIPREIQFYWNMLRNFGLTLGLGLLLFFSLGSSVIFTAGTSAKYSSSWIGTGSGGLRVISFLLAWVISCFIQVYPNQNLVAAYLVRRSGNSGAL